MVSAVTIQKALANGNYNLYLHNPGSTAATVLTPTNNAHPAWLDASTAENILVGVMNTVQGTGGSGPTLIEIVAATDTVGTNIQSIVTLTVASTAVENMMWLECLAAQIKEVAAAAGVVLRYVSARITTSNSGDKQTVLLALLDPKAPQSNLTPSFTT